MKNIYTQTMLLLVIFTVAIFLSGCAEATSVAQCVTDDPYGFWWGLLHGFIAPFTFIISLFNDEVAMYGVNNTGGWYDFGFLLGASIILGGSGRAGRR